MGNDEDRQKLLLQMYDQMFNDIDTHIKVVWQSIAVVVGAFAVFSAVEKKVISMDLAAALVVVITTWLLANLYDAGYWYNRNLAIIANIEKQFLRETDLREIHYYFGSHRPTNKLFTHLRIQFAFGVAIGATVLAWHFLERVLPGMLTAHASLDLQRGLPYLVLVAGIAYLRKLRLATNEKYAEFLANSPGQKVDTKGIRYGPGHGFQAKARTEETSGAGSEPGQDATKNPR